VNKVKSDEFEADRNALIIYCGCGFPMKEGATAFLKVFYRTPSDINIARIEQIMDFMRKYKRDKFQFV
jgi:hypothetical protein